ncbi:MAG TPA: hypothetical protein VHD59_03950 [Pseudolabrys sp.]|jgi:hypothetical protein|nr:hypothetical protein [Pseudolabrys sp.]HVV78754.1 hypothetical protein [Pseudolabrys sp.]
MRKRNRHARSAVDRALFAAVTRGWDNENLADYPGLLKRHDAAIPPSVLSTFQSIDTKAAGMLTHVSMMIAGLGLLAPIVADNDVEMSVIIVEIAIYLLIAVGCLRCLSAFGGPEMGDAVDDIKARVTHELILRRELYRVCNRVSILFTIVVFVLLPILYVWTPVKVK